MSQQRRVRHRQISDDVAVLQSVEGRRDAEDVGQRRQGFAAVQWDRLDDDAAAAGAGNVSAVEGFEF